MDLISSLRRLSLRNSTYLGAFTFEVVECSEIYHHANIKRGKSSLDDSNGSIRPSFLETFQQLVVIRQANGESWSSRATLTPTPS